MNAVLVIVVHALFPFFINGFVCTRPFQGQGESVGIVIGFSPSNLPSRKIGRGFNDSGWNVAKIWVHDALPTSPTGLRLMWMTFSPQRPFVYLPSIIGPRGVGGMK